MRKQREPQRLFLVTGATGKMPRISVISTDLKEVLDSAVGRGGGGGRGSEFGSWQPLPSVPCQLLSSFVHSLFCLGLKKLVTESIQVECSKVTKKWTFLKLEEWHFSSLFWMGTVAFRFWLCVNDSLAKWLWLRQELCTFSSWTTWESSNSLESPYAMDG